ncbi:hypothetical protein DPMN_121211 [Dreissena polymorpha]|uniref:Uncharacterized protein n=1 Tax=Dreissena polymorpha TaxID=45954 RepID=A0A9D4GLP4_DREPO|nr:hypothetical protein DPMN_121211 [Dreissena polymorpha]
MFFASTTKSDIPLVKSNEINEYKSAVSEHLRSTQLDYTDVNETHSHIVRCISSAAEKCV